MYIPNATITAKISGTTPTGFNPVTGAPIFQETDITAICSLEEGNPPSPESMPGIEETAVYLTGRAVEPTILPDAFIPNQRYDCTVELAAGTVVGKFYLLPLLRGRLGLESVFGEAIAGWFTR